MVTHKFTVMKDKVQHSEVAISELETSATPSSIVVMLISPKVITARVPANTKRVRIVTKHSAEPPADFGSRWKIAAIVRLPVYRLTDIG